jgi:hypothetical protein
VQSNNGVLETPLQHHMYWAMRAALPLDASIISEKEAREGKLIMTVTAIHLF